MSSVSDEPLGRGSSGLLTEVRHLEQSLDHGPVPQDMAGPQPDGGGIKGRRVGRERRGGVLGGREVEKEAREETSEDEAIAKAPPEKKLSSRVVEATGGDALTGRRGWRGGSQVEGLDP